MTPCQDPKKLLGQNPEMEDCKLMCLTFFIAKNIIIFKNTIFSFIFFFIEKYYL